MTEKQLKGMTLGQLKQRIEELLEWDPDLKDTVVMHQSDYGDYCHTQQGLPFKNIRIGLAREAAYSDSGFAVVDERYDNDGDYEDEEHIEVIILTDDY
jgi:hypothetical protein